jgi:ankyrin repeat protein
MCFSPPTATFLGQKFGVDEEGTPNNERPDGIESPADWIKPGGPKSRERCIDLCLKAGADPNVKDFHDFTPLHYAAMWGWTPACKLLLRRGADINATNLTGRTPLMFAVEGYHSKTVKFLANYGDPDTNELNIADADGQTALLMAMDMGDDGLDMIETLVDAGADVNMMNHKKKTPLHIGTPP